MDVRKTLVLVFVLIYSLLLPQIGFAAIEDEQWPTPNEYGLGHHSVLIRNADASTVYSKLTTQYEKGTFLCKSANDEHCGKGWYLDYNAVFPVCENSLQVNCIESLSAINEKGDVSPAKFEEYTYKNHPNMYQGDTNLGVPIAGSPSIWKIPGAPHAGGIEYAIVAGLDGLYHKTDPNYRFEDFYLYLSPVSRKSGIWAGTDINGFENYSKCIQKLSASGDGYLACGGGAQEFGVFNCAVKTDQNGDCYLQRPFPADIRYGIKVRLAKEPISWLHGRLLNPIIQISKLATGGVELSVEAGSLKVPIFYSGGNYSSLDTNLKEYWDKCLAARSCGYSTRIAGSDFHNQPDGNLRNVQDYAEPYGDRAINLIQTFSKSAGDKSVAVPSFWNLRSLTREEMSKANGCFNEGPGVKGIVTTNSTAYSEGPPTFKDGQLNYKVASAHSNPDGSDFKGTYNLVIRSDVARCLYKFSAAPLYASIEVVSDNGQSLVATTVFGERNGWVQLAAYNFGFSAPTLRVRLSQEAEASAAALPMPTPSALTKPALRPVTITCVKGKISKKVSAIKPKCPAGYKKK